MDTTFILAALGGYLLGSIPFGLIIARMAGKGDIRNIGSGNIGATNVLRTGRKDLAILTLLLDAGKAGIAAVIAQKIAGSTAGLVAGAFAVLGHCYPIWLGFKGGKGVATYFGFLIAVGMPIAWIAGATWLSSALLTRMSSLSALLAVIVVPIVSYFMGFIPLAIATALLGIVIFIRHKDNIKRIQNGTEPKIGKKKS